MEQVGTGRAGRETTGTSSSGTKAPSKTVSSLEVARMPMASQVFSMR